MLKKFLVRYFGGAVKNKKRRYISPDLGVEGFFDELKRRSVDYCVLRWFDDLPNIKKGEDIDILVADKDIDSICDLFSGSINCGIPCDVYSESGLTGSDFRGVSYYPPLLARQILENTCLYKNKFKIPSPYYHLLSIVYHCLFHKGYSSALPETYNNFGNSDTVADHDYEKLIINLSYKVNDYVDDCSLDGLYQFLKHRGWTPPFDTMEKLAYKNKWIKDKFFSNINASEAPVGLSAFIIRDKGMKVLNEIKYLIAREGFEIICENHLSGSVLNIFSRDVRGGNWYKGPWQVSGGYPAYIIIAIDVFPIIPSDNRTLKNFTLDNERIVLAKDKVRKYYNSTVSSDCTANVLHSSDNSVQAIHYAKVAKLDLSYINSKASDLISSVYLPWDEVGVLSSHSRRALVRTVTIDGVKFVAKTFRTHSLKYLLTEKYISDYLSNCENVLSCIDHIGNHLLYPYVKSESQINKIFSVNDIIKVRSFINYACSSRVQLIDFKPSNVVKSKFGDIYFLDFEFSLIEDFDFRLTSCYCWGEYPENIELPAGSSAGVNNYNKNWLSSFMMPRWVVIKHSNYFYLYCARLIFTPFYWMFYRAFLPLFNKTKRGVLRLKVIACKIVKRLELYAS